MRPLLAREFARLQMHEDPRHTAATFKKIVPLLFAASCFLGIGISMNAKAVAVFVGGSKFESAWLGVLILGFYPIHQSYGQVTTSLFYAHNKTRLYRNIGLLGSALGIPLSLFLIGAPGGVLPGLALGATGLCLKMLLIQFVSVMIGTWFCQSHIGLRFADLLKGQLTVVCSTVLLAGAARFVAHALLPTAGHAQNLLNAALYFALFGGAIANCPLLFGIPPAVLLNVRNAVRTIFFPGGSR
jgi:O-antigen/teichoic acid export membrane protein